MPVMQLEKQRPSTVESLDAANLLHLPSGLRGFPELTDLELVYDPAQLPLMWLREPQPNGIQFLVAEAGHLFTDYTIELFEEDVAELGLTCPEDAMILNILTFVPHPREQIYANQIGPVVVNRFTQQAKQVIIKNYQDYSARRSLLP